jgi:hypothetical protein
MWRWYPERENLDFAASMHAFGLSDSAAEGLLHILKKEFPVDVTIAWQAGFLNVRLAPNTFAAMVGDWSAEPQQLLAFLQVPLDLNAEIRLWPYRWLVILHEAAVLAHLPGWNDAKSDSYVPEPEEIKLVKQLLALPSLLQQKGELRRKRTDIMQGLTVIIQQLWKYPILTPANPSASSFRQALLKLVLAMATAVGDPLLQAPKDAIGILD